MSTRSLTAVTALVLAAGGCSPSSAGEPAAPSLTVVATVYPLAWIAEEIAVDAEVIQLGARGMDPHDLELTPSEHALARSADVALYVGDIGFMPQVERVLRDSSAIAVAAAEIAGDARLLDYGGTDHADDDHADDDLADDDLGRDGIDPHLWFASSVMADVALAAGEAFAQADAANAEEYRARAQQVADELLALDGEIDALLDDCRHDTVIVSHEAYAYLLADRGVRQEGISGAGGHGEATPQRIAALVAEIEHEGIGAVLTEPVEGRQDAEAVAAEAGAALIEIYSLDIVDDGQRAAGYPQLLREQAEAVAQALECG